MTTERDAQIYRAVVGENRTIQSCAEHFGVSQTTIRRALDRHQERERGETAEYTTDDALAEALDNAQRAAQQIGVFLRSTVQTSANKARGRHYKALARRLDQMREEHDELRQAEPFELARRALQETR